MLHQQFLNHQQYQPEIKKKVLGITHQVMTKMKATSICQNQQQVNNSQHQFTYFLTVTLKQNQNINCILKFIYCQSNILECSASFSDFNQFDKFKIKGKQRMIAHFNNILSINQNFQLSLNSFGHLKLKNSIIFISPTLEGRILNKFIQEKIMDSVTKIISILKNMFSSLTLQDKYAKSIKKYKSNLLNLREAFQKNRKMRKKASSITLKLKQLKIVSQVMDLLSMNKIKLSQIKQLKSNVNSGVDLYQKIQRKITNKQKQVVSSIGIILKAITIKEKLRQNVLHEGDFSYIYEGIYKFKHEITLFNYDDVSPAYIETKVQQVINSKCQIKNKEQQKSDNQNEVIIKQLIQKRPTEKFKDVFKNQLILLLFVRNLNCPYIAQYYCQKEQKLFQSQKFYIQKYQLDLANISQRLDYKKKIKIVYKLSVFLQFLKIQKVCHRDLKPNNIMIDSKLNPRVIDWGSCCGFYYNSKLNGDFKQQVDYLISTKGYFQSYNEIQYSKLKDSYNKDQVQKGQFFDIYSFGRILVDIFEFNAQNEQEQIFFDHIKYLQLKCSQKNPQDRLSALQIQIYLIQLKKAVFQAYNDELINQMQEGKDSIQNESSQLKQCQGSENENFIKIQT